MGITIETLTKVKKIFEEKNWIIDDAPDLFSSIFNRFCSRLDLFGNEHQELIIELTSRFLDLSFKEFQPCFIDALKKIPGIDTFNSILVAPLKRPSLSEPKSADLIWYYLKTISDFSYESFGSKLYFTADWEQITKSLANQSVILVLIDDFIGTGETVIESLQELCSEKQLKISDNVKVLTFIAHKEGINAVKKEYNDIVTYSIAVNKGLSDHYFGDDLIKKMKLMNEMEQKLNVRPEFELGYGRSECLVAVNNRSANNTFPIFWLEKKKKLAPFKR